MSRRTKIIAGVGGAAAAALIIGVSVVWPGLDAQQTPPVNTTLWALSADSSRYARVNMAVGELDTVRTVANPSTIVQSPDAAYLYADSLQRVTKIDQALPADLDQATLRTAPATPSGTQQVAAAGRYLVYLTDDGGVYWADTDGAAATPLQLEVSTPSPSASADSSAQAPAEDAPEFTASAVAVSEQGDLFAYSNVADQVLHYSIPRQQVITVDQVPASADTPQLSAVGTAWVLFDEATGTLWQQGEAEPRAVDTAAGTVYLSRPTTTGTSAYLADTAGLISVPLDGSDPVRVSGDATTDRGTPVRPAALGDQLYAAWLGRSSGVLWRSDGGDVPLDYGGEELGDDSVGRLSSNGSAMILNESRRGWVWTVPDGSLLPSSQHWDLDNPTDANAEPSEVQAAVVLDPKPPVAEPDAFGVRAGALATLPVLLNDHDPNADVLSIDPASITGIDPAFGTVSITDGGGRLAVNVTPGASGEVTFTYRVTDGSSTDGLYSEPAPVTLRVAAADEDTAPVWCGVASCLATWPEPEVRPGGTVRVPVLSGWVDPEGDPLLVLSVTNLSGVGAAAVTQRGEVVYQHTDPSATETQPVELDVTVSDTNGNVTTRALRVNVTQTPTLTAQSFTVMDTLGADLTVDVGDHVTGTAGTLSLESVRVLGDAAAQATAVPGSTTFDFTAKAAGSYRVAFTVTDGTGSVDGVARIILLSPDASPQLATAPVVAFVRPQEDATVDVLAAVSNPTGRVLMVDAVSSSADTGSTLQVDAVGEQFLRVSGSTQSGDPGRLGVVDYRISDGSEAADAQIRGQATVYLLAAATDLAPIAVDDTVVVRAGAQIDIPVLENDVAPSGGTLAIDPASVHSSAADALAFASESTVRYLAPSSPGVYTIDYGVYTAGSPSRLDTGRVAVTVIGDESNRDPKPRVLEGRVRAGQTVTIPFDRFGTDPDGDEVTIDRILAQPAQGSASISTDGTGIVFASAPGSKGQFSFQFRVVDPYGGSKTATARVAVLDQAISASPVTFTDYVQVQIGQRNVVTVSPLENDIDPAGDALVLTEVTPNIAATLADGSSNPEYERWQAMLSQQTDTSVTITAGLEAGTRSFLYRAESERGNTAIGLIVVKLVREAVPEYPVVRDTVLTVESRDQFADGVDVLAGKVSWAGGDAASLTVGLWGQQSGVQVAGRTLSGELPQRARIVPFTVYGVAADGTAVVSYAFLRIPGADDRRISLRAGLATLEVDERAAVSFEMADLVVLPRDGELEISSQIVTWGARAQATCTLGPGGVITYTAGEGAPWSDACQVPVRLVGEQEWTILAVPIRVRALDPIPALHAASITVQPGASQSFDLQAMVSWVGREDWPALAYAVGAGGTGISATLQGSRLEVAVADTARPGTELALPVSLASHPDVAAANLLVRVGAAPSTLPRGGTVTLACSQSQTGSCAVQVVGAAGEVNPLPATPLRLTAVAQTASCAGVTFQVVDATTVSASWTNESPGGSCQVPFTLVDAQERTTGGDRAGIILFDLRGYPRAPASVSQTRYADGTVGLQVDPGAARDAYPAITGFAVTTGGSTVTTCAADGSCPDFSAPNGEKRSYQVVAVNEVGASRSAVSTTAWAYRPPAAPGSLAAKPVPNGDGGGKVELVVSGIDALQTDRLVVTAPGATETSVKIGSSQTAVVIPFLMGTNRAVPVTVTPISRFEVPPVAAGGATAGAAVTVQTNGVGVPTGVSLTAAEPVAISATQASVRLTGSATPGGDNSGIRYQIVRAGEDCTTAPDRASVDIVVSRDARHDFLLCATSVWDGTAFATATATVSVNVFASPEAPDSFRFVVDPAPASVETGKAYWRITQQPTGTVPAGYTSTIDGFPSNIYGADPGIRVRVRSNAMQNESPWGAVLPKAGSAPEQTSVSWWLPSCTVGAAPEPTWTAEASRAPDVAFDWADATYTVVTTPEPTDPAEEPGEPVTTTVPAVAGEQVPEGATKLTGLRVRVSWGTSGWNLNGVDSELSADCR